MCVDTCTSTVYVAHDIRFAEVVSTFSQSYRHHRILFHAANHTTAKDITFHRTVTDNDSCSALGMCNTISIKAHHRFVTGEIVGLTHARSVHVLFDIGITSHGHIVIIHFIGTDLYLGSSIHVTQTTATKDGAIRGTTIDIDPGISSHTSGI